MTRTAAVLTVFAAAMLTIAGCIFAFVRSLSWESLIIGATSPGAYIMPPALFSAYLSAFSPVPGTARTDNGLTPAAFIINGCSGHWAEQPACVTLLDDFLRQHGSIDARSDDALGFAPLHLAVLYADEALVSMLLERGANTQVKATGKKYDGMRPTDLAMALATASKVPDMVLKWQELGRQLE